MANPQIENGYTRIANELLEAVCRFRFSGNEMRILLFIIRMTYGYSRKSAEIPLSLLQKETGISKNHVSEIIKHLSECGVLTIQRNTGVRPTVIAVQKDYEKWQCSKKAEQFHKTGSVPPDRNTEGSVNQECTVPENRDSDVPQNGNHTLYKEKKENIKEKGKERTPHGRYGNVLLYDYEFENLAEDFGRDNTLRYIDKVDAFMEAKGRCYELCEPIIRKWLIDDDVKSEPESDVSKYDIFLNRF